MIMPGKEDCAESLNEAMKKGKNSWTTTFPTCS